jgi:hypothetical protein
MQRQAVAHKNSLNGSICTHTAGLLFYYFDCLCGELAKLEVDFVLSHLFIFV